MQHMTLNKISIEHITLEHIGFVHHGFGVDFPYYIMYDSFIFIKVNGTESRHYVKLLRITAR